MTQLYKIRIDGQLDDGWQGWFDGMSITLEEDGTTLLSGPVPDQPALYGLLRKVRDLGLPLVSVNQITATLSQQIINKKRNTKMNKNSITIEMEYIKVSLKLKLVALWTSLMFLVIYLDYFHLYMPGKIEEILAGKMFVFDITQVSLLAGLATITIPALMISLSATLPDKANRWTNIIVAVIYLPFVLFNLAGAHWAHMLFGAAVQVILLLLITGYAWKWPK
jgi:hypothetical protein